MTDRVDKAINALKSTLQSFCPYDTGNLESTIREVSEGAKRYIVIGGEVADYASYTNEPWAVGQNPNEGWVQKAIHAATPIMQAILGGTISQAEYDEYMAEQSKILAATRQARIKEIKGQ